MIQKMIQPVEPLFSGIFSKSLWPDLLQQYMSGEMITQIQLQNRREEQKTRSIKITFRDSQPTDSNISLEIDRNDNETT